MDGLNDVPYRMLPVNDAAVGGMFGIRAQQDNRAVGTVYNVGIGNQIFALPKPMLFADSLDIVRYSAMEILDSQVKIYNYIILIYLLWILSV